MTEEDKRIKQKRETLSNMLNKYEERHKQHYKKYIKYRQASERWCAFTGICSASSIALTVSGFTFQPILIGAVVTSSISFISARLYESSRFAQKAELHKTSASQYLNLWRDLGASLLLNNMTSHQYYELIIQYHHNVSIIEDSAPPI